MRALLKMAKECFTFFHSKEGAMFNDELAEVVSTLMECRAVNSCEPQLARRIDNAVELVRDVQRRVDGLAKAAEIPKAPAQISLFPVAATPVPDEFLQAFKLASELAVKATRKLEFIEDALRMKLEAWKVQGELHQHSEVRYSVREKIAEIERVLANARA